MTLNDLKPSEKGIITSIKSNGNIRRRLIDMGLTPDTQVLLKKIAPFNGPIEITVRNYSLSIRRSDAKEIEIKKV